MIFSPLQSKLMRLGRPGVAACEVATRNWIVSPQEESESPSAVYLADELSRITGYSAHSSAVQELARLQPHTTVRRATIASRIDDAVMCGGNLYAGGYKCRMRNDRRLFARVSTEIEDGGVPCSTWLGGLYFGHWLAEDTASKLLCEPFGTATEVDFVQTPHQAGYNALFGIHRHVLPDVCRVRRLTIVDSDLASSYLDAGWRRMTAAIEAAYPAPPHIGCMLLRGGSGQKRLLLNEGEVAGRLRSMGFRVVDPSKATLAEILSATSGARIVVGVEGSQMAHGFHCLREHGAMLVLQPPDRFGCIDKDRCDRKGALYAFSVGHAETGGFRIDMDSLQRVLDMLIATLRSRSAVGLN